MCISILFGHSARLRIFPFSLRDKAKSWLRSLPSNSISTWDDLAQKFLARFFIWTKAIDMRKDIKYLMQCKSVRDYAMPLVDEIHSSIRSPTIQVDNFEINPEIIQIIQTSVQFGGLFDDDPSAHIIIFLDICDTFKYNEISDDAIRLRLFPFSLRDKAKSWLRSLPSNSITMWDDLVQKFLANFFPPSKTAKMRNDILSFVQYDSEPPKLGKDTKLLQRCHHHELSKWFQVQVQQEQPLMPQQAGALMGKSIDEAYELLEKMSSINYQ